MSSPLTATVITTSVPTGNYSYIIIFSLVGLFILLIASLNYMNMATAISFGELFQPGTLLLILLIALFVGLISGSYPSFYLSYLSSFSPLEVLKSNVNPRRGKGLMRMILVIFQFAIAGALITGTIVVSGQQIMNSLGGFMKYLSSKKK
ncbi:MAG: hypothetical protein L0Y37_05630 [Bacteroidales bacterium]|nr:hypothetical protein [Bacteroidales bacterium]